MLPFHRYGSKTLTRMDVGQPIRLPTRFYCTADLDEGLAPSVDRTKRTRRTTEVGNFPHFRSPEYVTIGRFKISNVWIKSACVGYTLGPVTERTRSTELRERLNTERDSPLGRNPMDDKCSTYCCFKEANISKVLTDKKFFSAKTRPARFDSLQASLQA